MRLRVWWSVPLFLCYSLESLVIVSGGPYLPFLDFVSFVLISLLYLVKEKKSSINLEKS